MILKLKDGDVKIELFADVAPNHVKRIKELAEKGKYDGVVFHRVIDGFMAQTGDVKFGNSSNEEYDLRRAGLGSVMASSSTPLTCTRWGMAANSSSRRRAGDAEANSNVMASRS